MINNILFWNKSCLILINTWDTFYTFHTCKDTTQPGPSKELPELFIEVTKQKKENEDLRQKLKVAYETLGRPAVLSGWKGKIEWCGQRITSKKILVSWATARQNQQNDCAPSEDSDQPGYPPSLIRVFVLRPMDSLGPKLSSCGQRRLWSNWADAQADPSLHWAHMPFCWFCHVAAQLLWASVIINTQKLKTVRN